MDNIVETTSQEEFVKSVCEKIKEECFKRIKEKGKFTIVLAGGQTPKIIFDELILSYKNSIDWGKISFFWVDERCVAPTDKSSNFKLAYDHLLSKLNSVGSIHRIKGEIEVDKAAKDYQKDLINFFKGNEIKFDFVLLGMGEDGHVASLFPNSKEIKKTNELVLATEKAYDGFKRITMSLDLINEISYKLLIIKGEKKLKTLFSKNETLPISNIKYKHIYYLK
tara:strand:+ start:870 stop:1538 length:669 start_codon:yes stop_codon:yes gene_type:complete